MKILYYIIVGFLCILLLKFVVGLVGATFKFFFYLFFVGLIGFIVVSIVNRGK